MLEILLGLILQIGAGELVARLKADGENRQTQKRLANAILAGEPDLNVKEFRAWLADPATWQLLLSLTSSPEPPPSDTFALCVSLDKALPRGSSSPQEWLERAESVVVTTVLRMPASLGRDGLFQAALSSGIRDLKFGQDVLLEVLLDLQQSLEDLRESEQARSLDAERYQPAPVPEGMATRSELLGYVTDAMAGLPTDEAVIVLVGEPGMGKSTIARQFLEHAPTREQFPEPLWIDLGPSMSPRELADSCRGLRALTESEPERRLVVVDDAWTEDQVSIVRQVVHADTMILVTTRSTRVATRWRWVEIGPLTSDEGVRALMGNLDLPDGSAADADRLVHDCLGWALLLRLINGFLVLRAAADGDVGAALRRARALLTTRGPAVFDEPAQAATVRVQRTIDASLDLLGNDSASRYAKLGALAEVSFDTELAAALWACSIDEADLTLLSLSEVALVRHDRGSGRGEIHGLIQEHLRRDRLDAFDEEQFSTRLQTSDMLGHWYSLRHLPTHLARTGDLDSLSRLISAEYLSVAINSLGSVTAVLRVCEAYLEVAKSDPREEILAASVHAAHVFGDLASLHTSAYRQQIDLYLAAGRADQAIEVATFLTTRSERSTAFALLANRFREGGDARRAADLLQRAYREADGIEDGYERALALGQIAVAPLRMGQARGDSGAVERVVRELQASRDEGFVIGSSEAARDLASFGDMLAKIIAQAVRELPGLDEALQEGSLGGETSWPSSATRAALVSPIALADPEFAYIVLQSISDDERRLEATADLALAAAIGGHVDLAREVPRMLESVPQPERDWVYYRMARAPMSDYEQANWALEQIHARRLLARGHAHLAGRQGIPIDERERHVQCAMERAAALESPIDRAISLLDLVESIADAADAFRNQIVRSLDETASALEQADSGLVAAGLRSRRVVLESQVTGDPNLARDALRARASTFSDTSGTSQPVWLQNESEFAVGALAATLVESHLRLLPDAMTLLLDVGATSLTGVQPLARIIRAAPPAEVAQMVSVLSGHPLLDVAVADVDAVRAALAGAISATDRTASFRLLESCSLEQYVSSAATDILLQAPDWLDEEDRDFLRAKVTGSVDLRRLARREPGEVQSNTSQQHAVARLLSDLEIPDKTDVRPIVEEFFTSGIRISLSDAQELIDRAEGEDPVVLALALMPHLDGRMRDRLDLVHGISSVHRSEEMLLAAFATAPDASLTEGLELCRRIATPEVRFQVALAALRADESTGDRESVREFARAAHKEWLSIRPEDASWITYLQCADWPTADLALATELLGSIAVDYRPASLFLIAELVAADEDRAALTEAAFEVAEGVVAQEADADFCLGILAGAIGKSTQPARFTAGAVRFLYLARHSTSLGRIVALRMSPGLVRVLGPDATLEIGRDLVQSASLLDRTFFLVGQNSGASPHST
jgi:hypothetical protein